MPNTIDLRSDTAIQPTTPMLEAVRHLQFGDDLLCEDQSTNTLVTQACTLLGKEDAVLTPSGTMSNQIAIAALTQPGDEVLLGPKSHIRNLESAGLAVISGAQIRCIPVQNGVYDIDTLESTITSGTLQEAPTGLISLEATYDLNSGYVTPLENYQAIRRIATKHNLPVFLDGARLFNAAHTLDVEPHQICQYVDAVQFSLNKGIGAPLGAILLGTKNFIATARRLRQRLGGGMRHSGLLAAPAIIALNEWRTTIETDHINARWLADQLNTNKHLTINNHPIDSNIINLTLNHNRMTVTSLIQALEKRDIYVKQIGDASARLVTHRSVSTTDLQYVSKQIHQIIKNQ